MLYSTNEFFDGYTVVKYEPQSICNKNCSYCYVRDKKTGTAKDLIISDLTAILSAENPKIVLGIEGGEPILQDGFNEIIDHIYKTKKYETKIVVFTHADHDFEFFKSKIDQLKKFGVQCKIICSVHFEELNKEQFKKNVKYINDNFKYKTLFFVLNKAFMNEREYIRSILDECKELKMHGSIQDNLDDGELIKRLSYFKQLQEFSDRMDNTMIINGISYPHNAGLFEVYKMNRFVFTGNQCSVRDFEIDENGDIRMPCSNKILSNTRNNFNPSVFNMKTIPCQEKKCFSTTSNVRIFKS